MGLMERIAQPWRRKRADRDNLAVRPLDPFLIGTSLGQHRQDWQAAAWDAYLQNVGEYAAVVNWRAAAISRANLFVAELDHQPDVAPQPTTDPWLNARLELLGTGGDTGYSQSLRRWSIHLDVPGETFLVETLTRTGQPLVFPASRDQIEPYGAGVAIRLDDTGYLDRTGSTPDLLVVPPHDPDDPRPPTTRITRIYDPDPQRPWLAISPGRYSQKALRILDRLSDRVNANTLSRLTNDLLLFSTNVMLPKADGGDLHANAEMAGFIQAGMQAISDPESPSAVMPAIGRVNGNPNDAVTKVELGTKFDDQLVPLLNLYIRRLALTLNVPPEILLGVTDANHWSAYLVSDDTVRIHLAPTLELICDALTRAFLRPALARRNREAGRVIYDPSKYTVWYDTVRITQRPNRTENALASKEAGLISAESAREASGWDNSDAPQAAEIRSNLLMQAMLQGLPPADTQWYLDQLNLTGVGTRPDSNPGTPGPINIVPGITGGP